jgi:hypothetical protein
MKILVCGDSYATDHEHYSWLKLVVNYKSLDKLKTL